ncbi:MAG: LON peptidase substrate-binding domain-containing protein [Actinobacteria bacterium]|nr:LON peptidase substrate-binding domain-containing protein [Actinomycetota bacterium]
MTLRMPMFPLGTVLFPHQFLPLHVFEPRYREMTMRCLEGSRRFGVVLIERGQEVGGGDRRFGVGTVAEIVEAAQLPDGRWLLETVGRERLAVERWLPDDPHPWAEVDALTDFPTDASDDPLLTRVTERLRRLLALRTELGDPAPPATVALDPDPVVASWQIAVLAGLSPMDGLAVLGVDGFHARLAALSDLIAGELELCEARLF